MSKHWEPCPRCQSNKVKTIGKGLFFTLGFALIGFFWLGFLLPPLFLFPVVGAGLVVATPFIPATNQCQDCKHSWKVDKKKAPA